MKRMLTAAAIVAGVALSTTGLALAQSSTMSPASSPSATSPTMTPSNGTTNPAGTSGAASMNNPANGMSAANNPASMHPQSPDGIKQAQQQLKSQGLYNGAIDGEMGPETRSALSKFQQQNGLPQNAELDQDTMGRLMGNGGAAGARTTGTTGSSLPPSTMNPSSTPAQPGAASSSSSYATPGAGGSSTGGAMGTTSPSGTGTTGH